MIVAVSGCPRDKVSYTEQTVASLMAAGASDVYVYDDVCLTGSGPACHALIQELAERFPSQDVLLTEDDVIACKNAVPAAERVPFPPHCEALSFYYNRFRICKKFPKGVPLDYSNYDDDNLNFSKVPPMAGVHLQSVDTFGFSQAMKLSARAIKYIATNPWPDPCTIPRMDQSALIEMTPKNIRDTALAWQLSYISKFIGQVIPNWFEHVGDVSAAMLVHKFERMSRIMSGNWLGPNHDALTDDVSKVYVL